MPGSSPGMTSTLYCTLAPDISTSFRHLINSLSMKALNSAGVLPTGSLPCSASFAFNSAERNASIVALLMRSIISGGVLADEALTLLQGFFDDRR